MSRGIVFLGLLLLLLTTVLDDRATDPATGARSGEHLGPLERAGAVGKYGGARHLLPRPSLGDRTTKAMEGVCSGRTDP